MQSDENPFLSDANIPQSNGTTDLMIAVKNGDLNEVKKLLASGADPNVLDEWNSSALLQACYHIDTFRSMCDIIRELLDRGANQSVRDRYGRSPLSLVSSSGKSIIVSKMLDMGADPNVQDEDGETALMCASKYLYTEIINELLKRGADPEIKDNKGRTAKMFEESDIEN